MPQFVSVPEKTLEHWSSQYIMYRYGSKAALWWPARGEDINVAQWPSRPGKAVQLELKTTTVAGPGLHDVVVDLGQLWEYRQRPQGHQPFYAFPRPDWDGSLTDVAVANGRAVTELGFSRSGVGWWFADWMVVLTSEQIEAVLHREVAAHGSARRGVKKRLVRFNVKHPAKSKWGPTGAGSPPPGGLIGWLDFWSELERCGRAGWPQVIRFPARWATSREAYDRQLVAGLLLESAYSLQSGEDALDLVTLEPDSQGNYLIASAPVAPGGLSGRDLPGMAEEHRQIVFLDARVMLRGQQ